MRWNVGVFKCSDERRKVGDVGVQEFNKGIFDYLIATDDPAKRLEQEEEAAKPAPQLKPAPVKAKGKGRDRDRHAFRLSESQRHLSSTLVAAPVC